MMQELPYLADWQQANTDRAESQQGAHHESTSTELSEARQQSQLRSAEAAGIVSQDPPAKRQRTALSVGDMEQQMQAKLEQLRSDNGQRELQLQIDTEQQADIKLRRMAELQAATARQDELGIAQQEEILTRRQLMWKAQGGSAITAQAMSASIPNQVVQLSNIPFVLAVQNQAALSVSGTAQN